ncbi:MAG: alpha-amylase family glycosyl hydrolase [Rhodoplanes sp.]
MARLRVRFEWLTGLKQPIFRNVRLVGSWDRRGRYSDQTRTVAMKKFTAPDGCPAWRADVRFDDAQRGCAFRWSVIVDTPHQTSAWGIPTEVSDPNSSVQERSFELRADGQVERYWLTSCRRLGANKLWRNGARNPALMFSVWAPNAREVDAVIGDPATGYIWSDGRGAKHAFKLTKRADGSGVWESDPEDPALADFARWDHQLYMFRIRKDDGSVAYRTDLYSRCQIGSGQKKPENPRDGEAPWNHTRQDLDGSKSCSMVIDPECVSSHIDDDAFPPAQSLDDTAFWATEYDRRRPVPKSLDELVIYEMHVDGLGSEKRDAAGNPLPGSFHDAVDLLDHLVELGVNAIELMPLTEAEGWSWGYGTSHYFAIEHSGGGPHRFKHFVRECHRRGIAVLVDVVYNHFIHDAERAQWMYDNNTHSKNIYYWYQGKEADWAWPEGGYLSNGSSGATPNFRSEMVRQLFISSAAMLLSEFHVDGFRVDLTQAFHRDNVIDGNGEICAEANLLGTKFLREWVRTLRLLKPSIMLTAEDHTGWKAITEPQERNGIGFDAIWWAEWYHQLIGDSQNDSRQARLLHHAGFGANEPLAISSLATALLKTPGHVIYHESHDQAGNAAYWEGDREVRSARTIQTAVNGELDGNRDWAEARCRVVSGLTLLAPGIPMFFMGEEVGAKEPYRYNDWLHHREDFQTLRATSGAKLFNFYRDVIRLRRQHEALRSPHVEVLYMHDANRVLAFRRWLGHKEFLVVATLSNAPFADGYRISHKALRLGVFVEVLNSDSAAYGGKGVTNPRRLISAHGDFNAHLPANGIVVFQRVSAGALGSFFKLITLEVADWARRLVEIFRAR